jgi:hypothetical protein
MTKKQKIGLALLVIISLLVGFGLGAWMNRSPRLFQVTDTRLGPCEPYAATTSDCHPLPTPEPTPSPSPLQSGKIDEHVTINNNLRDVNFCGDIYKARQILIDGTDVVQRIAMLATRGELKSNGVPIENGFCKYVKERTDIQNIYHSKEQQEVAVPGISSYIDDNKHKIYVISIASTVFAVDSITGYLYAISAFDGSLGKPISKLRYQP